MAALFAGCLYILNKGYFRLVSHLIFISAFSVFWLVMCLDQSSLIIRLDTVVYLIAVYTLLPLFFDHWLPIIIYSFINFCLFFLYTWTFHDKFTEEITDFFVDTTVAISFVSLATFHIVKIKKSLLEKAKEEILNHKNAEKTILSEKERLQVTLQSIGDGVITTDTNENVIIINKVAQHLTGWSQDEAYGKPLTSVFNIINAISGQKIKNPVEKVLHSEEIKELTNHTILISKDGTERVITDSGSPIKDSQGNIIGVVLVIRDMTEKQKLIDAAQKTQKLKSLGTLAGGIAHDFNNLLTGIYGLIGFARQTSENRKVIEILNEAGETIDRARSLSHQLLTFAKGGVPVKKLQPIENFLLDSVRFSLSGSNILCCFNICKKLMDAEFDKHQLSQVIDNIILNSVQAIPNGGKILVSAQNITLKEEDPIPLPPGKYIKISLSDNGPGIPDNIVSKIFDPFFSTKSNGHGLGLAMCYSIVCKHHGHISVESELNRGTTFNIFLPASAKKATGIKKTEFSENRNLKKGKILIMDDDSIVNEVTSRIVSKSGYQVTSVKNGEEAVQLFTEAFNTEQKFDTLIFDLTIQDGMGGKEAIKTIREIDKNVIAFVSTGYSDDPIVSNPYEYGFTDSIPKPFSAEELIEKLQKHQN